MKIINLSNTQTKKVVSYVESSDDDEPFPYRAPKSRRSGRAQRAIKEDSDDDFGADAAAALEEADDGEHQFDDSREYN